MSARYIRHPFAGKIHDPFYFRPRSHLRLAHRGRFVAVADGRVDWTEREEAVHYIDQAITPKTPKARIAGLFDRCAHLLQDRDFAEVVLGALRPVPALSLTSAVIEIAERVAAADGRVHPNEAPSDSADPLDYGDSSKPEVVNSSRI